MGKEIGDIIYQIRQESGLGQKQVCEGLCSVAHFARIEQNQTAIDYFMLDRIFGRLGKSTERLEYILPRDAYEIYELQYLVQKSICHSRLEEAETHLKEYERRKVAAKPLHRQFIMQERAQIGWIKGENAETILRYVEEAIGQSMPLENAIREIALSAEEIKLLLFRWEICLGIGEARSEKEVRELLEYINERKLLDIEAVKVLPYAVILLGKICDWRKEAEYLEGYTRRALTILRDTGKLLYMPKILGQYAKILEFRGIRPELVRVLRQERASLLETEKAYEISFEKFRLFQHINRRFEIDYELIKRMRVSRGISQEALCEDICTQEALSRIENGRSSPRNKVICKLLEKMGRKGSTVHTVIMVEDYEVLELKREYFGKLHKLKYDEAYEKLIEIEQRLDMSYSENRQFLQSEKTKIRYCKGEISGEESLAILAEILQETVDLQKIKMTEQSFTTEEHSVLSIIALILFGEQRKAEAAQVLKMQLQALNSGRVRNVFHILEWELVVGNLATALEELGQTETAIGYSKERIEVAMEAGKGNGIGRALVTMASAMDQESKEECALFYVRGGDSLKLYRHEARYQLVEKYITSSKFHFYEKFKHYRDQIRLHYQQHK
ncbi:helix-turn-helix transcriptional regulator [Roseburia hominis]